MTAQTTIYVNQNVSGGLQNGDSWANAYSDLQAALATAQYGDEIWVAAGTYYPTTTLEREISFHLRNGVRLLGGFNGTEQFSTQRNPAFNITGLSGNIGGLSTIFDNSFHVLRGKGLDGNTLTDGFVISDGQSDGVNTNPSDDYGGGLYLIGSVTQANSRPVFSNCLFKNNHAGGAGGAVFIGFRDLDDPSMAESLVNPVFKQCTFDQNDTGVYGGAIFKEGPTGMADTFLLADCLFTNNYAFALDGGGIYFARPGQSNINITRCHFEGNKTQGGQGGGFSLPSSSPGGYTTSLVLDSCIFRNNTATEGGGFFYDGRSFPEPDITFNLQIRDCLFEDNLARNENGGAYLITSGLNYVVNAEITNCKFLKNKTNSSFTSAFLCYDESIANVLLESCEFIGNVNKVDPGGYCAAFDAGGSKTNTRINNCLFAYNGAALFARSYENSQVFTQVTNCTFFRNGKQPFGKGWYNSYNQSGTPYYNKMHFYNCAIWEPGNSLDLFYNINNQVFDDPWFFLDYCSLHPLQLWQIPNSSQFLGDSIFVGIYPAFQDTLGLNFRLKQCSPAVNRGDNLATVNAGLLTDLNGNPRIRHLTVDLGAYEVQDSCIMIGSSTPDLQLLAAQISPNPVSPGMPLHVQLPDFPSWQMNWVIWDAFGSVIDSGSQRNVTNESFFIDAPISTGIYFVELCAGAQIVRQKIIVQQ